MKIRVNVTFRKLMEVAAGDNLTDTPLFISSTPNGDVSVHKTQDRQKSFAEPRSDSKTEKKIPGWMDEF